MKTDKQGLGILLQGAGDGMWIKLQKSYVPIFVYFWLIALSFCVIPNRTGAQIRPVYDQGALGLGRLLKRLNTAASVMMIGAHPDDEDTALLTYLARGENARTAYLSLTRGDGGQNIIGPELGEALGVIRTEELLQARKLDGAEQYFTRAYDYGFSKSLAEAREKWDEKIVLCDAVRVIRQFRPLVVVSQFSGTPADGHGQHQYSGYISPLAVKAAADSSQCRNAGPAWQVKKVYVRHRGSGEPRLRINTGAYDPLLGRSYFEIAMEARSQHRSQEQGVLELKGTQFSGLNLIGSEAKETGIFDGIDVSVRGIAANAENSSELLLAKLYQLEKAASSTQSESKLGKPLTPWLTNIYKLARGISSSNEDPAIRAAMIQKQAEALVALKLAMGIQIDALAERETVIPGDTLGISVKSFYGGKDNFKVKNVKVLTPAKWTVSVREAPKENSQGFFRRETGDHEAYFTVGVPSDAVPTQPYWLSEPRDGDLFGQNESDNQRGLPFYESELNAEVTMDIEGTEITFTQPVEYRYADDTRGEIRRNVAVVPAVSVELDQSLLVVPSTNGEQTRQIALSITNHSILRANGLASIEFNSGVGWIQSTSSPTFDLKKKGEKTTVVFEIRIPAGAQAGSHRIIGNARVGESTFNTTMSTLAYPHIQTRRIYRSAEATAKVFDLKVKAVKVGYIAGSGDQMPEAIRQIGLDVELLDEKYLSSGPLSKFDVIVAGIRVSEVRPDFAANNQRLLEWVKNGGTLMVQYQRPLYAQQNLTPYPAQMGPRVADESAKVTILHPAHPIFNTPNKISDSDFDGWVQERNLYNFSTMDAKYIGLLESHDAGEPENNGGLVVADVGKGKYIYCSYALFRQLPAGVPGAYRLLANMLSYSNASATRAAEQ